MLSSINRRGKNKRKRVSFRIILRVKKYGSILLKIKEINLEDSANKILRLNQQSINTLIYRLDSENTDYLV